MTQRFIPSSASCFGWVFQELRSEQNIAFCRRAEALKPLSLLPRYKLPQMSCLLRMLDLFSCPGCCIFNYVGHPKVMTNFGLFNPRPFLHSRASPLTQNSSMGYQSTGEWHVRNGERKRKFPLIAVYQGGTSIAVTIIMDIMFIESLHCILHLLVH